jgi:hypothetical protein
MATTKMAMAAAVGAVMRATRARPLDTGPGRPCERTDQDVPRSPAVIVLAMPLPVLRLSARTRRELPATLYRVMGVFHPLTRPVIPTISDMALQWISTFVNL